MTNPLETTWDSFNTVIDSFEVVNRASAMGATRTTSFQLTKFASASDQQILNMLGAAMDQIEEQTVMFVYAKFEAVLRDHLTAQANLLAVAANPTPQFGLNLEGWFVELCKETRMDKVVDLFLPTVPQSKIADLGVIRKYRHWLAHGKRGPAVPSVTPLFAYTSLTGFLKACSLA